MEAKVIAEVKLKKLRGERLKSLRMVIANLGLCSAERGTISQVNWAPKHYVFSLALVHAANLGALVSASTICLGCDHEGWSVFGTPRLNSVS